MKEKGNERKKGNKKEMTEKMKQKGNERKIK
jgi:hypothetical protein